MLAKLIMEEIRVERKIRKVISQKCDKYKNCISITNNFISEIAELRVAISDLAREVRELRQEKEENQLRTQRSLSPNLSSRRYTKVRKILEPMDHEYKKAFRVSI